MRVHLQVSSLVAVDSSTPRLLDFAAHARGDGEVKRRSEPKLAVGPKPASVQAGDLLRDRETETGARDTAGDTGFDPLEAIEDPG